jgi:hypothetical protein
MATDECLKPTANKPKPSTGNVYQFIPRLQARALQVKGSAPGAAPSVTRQAPENDDDPGPPAA